MEFMLHGLGYSPQVNKKTLEDAKQIDRDNQFNNLNIIAQEQSLPAVSVGAKKKEN